MNESNAINALKATHRWHDWRGPVMGDNSVGDFVIGAGAYTPSDEVSDAIRSAVSNRIASALHNTYSTRDEAWGAWCKGEIDVDFSDIQEIVDDID